MSDGCGFAMAFLQAQRDEYERDYMAWFWDNYFNDPAFIDELCYDAREDVKESA